MISFLNAIGEFGNDIRDAIIRGEFSGISADLMNDEVSKNIVTVNTALRYAGVSDFEFFKSSVLVWIVIGICDRIRPNFSTR